MKKSDKERVVAELVERLRSTDTLLVADYRGLTMPQIDALRTQLLQHGARFSVVKNTLTRRAAEEAGADALLALLEGPTAIAFLEAGGDPLAAAKALATAARETRVLAIRGGVLEGRAVSADDVEELAKLPPVEALRGQVLGAIIAPLNALLALVAAPLQDLYGLVDARIAQLEEQGGRTETAEVEESRAGEAEVEAAEEATAAAGAASAGEIEVDSPESDAPAKEEE